MSGRKSASNEGPMFANSMRTTDNTFSEFWRQRLAKETRASTTFTKDLVASGRLSTTPMEATTSLHENPPSPTRIAPFASFACDLNPVTMRPRDTRLPPIKITSLENTMQRTYEFLPNIASS
eukprot:TRINITY_DN8684_c0_g1_i1.p2 TRINITY_DN8684_c0_g1~~TRINITY_DN8684_c0_g1_i1.p2  ORF type:complete len:122 (-),score=18.33 TRINITY_DN8684_c0_g1_i1:784-1149(-)